MKTMRFPGRVWLRRARAEYRIAGILPTNLDTGEMTVGGLPTAADIPMNVRSIRTKVMRQAKHK
jgi:hypothetical protein